MKFLRKIILLLLLFTCMKSVAQDLPVKPNPYKLVNDYTGTLTPDQQQALENKLRLFEDSTTTQIAVVIINSLNGNEIADYNIKLFRAWGVGTKAHNNGVVLLIAKSDRKLNITTGYGVEGALPDITCGQIIDDIIVPKFKGDDYYRGIEEGTNAIMQAVKGEYTATESGTTNPPHYPLMVRILFWVIGIIVVFILIKTGLFWPILNIAVNIVFSGSGSSGGGGGGFGGGSSGGGGASGSW